MLVTDIKRKIYQGRKDEREVIGFPMDGYLAENLDGIPQFLDQAWDCVGVISGRGKVRIGKSTLAAQIAYYLAWRIAGGEMHVEWDKKNKKRNITGMTNPKNPVRFGLEENVVFNAEDLQTTAFKLYDKYGKNQVIMYDEGRQGLDSARTMENINKGMEDFFQECGFMGHVILIVLPNFFKLHEDYAVARSLFLVDVFADKHYRRGYFNFYNEYQKEWLYYLGKKKIGVSQKYISTRPSFWGKYVDWMPFDKDEYNALKKKALDKKRKTRREKNLMLQRDFLVWRLSNHYEEKDKELVEEFERVVDVSVGIRTLQKSRERINEIVSKKRGY